jgi:hypothetical protein
MKVSTILKAPDMDTGVAINLTAKATATGAHMGDGAQSTTIIPDKATAVFLPSGQATVVSCRQALDSGFFLGNTVHLTASLRCALTDFGLSVSASNVMLDLNGKKIVGEAGDTVPCKIGIVIEQNATNVAVRGGRTSGTSGIEYFDWCIRDERGIQAW